MSPKTYKDYITNVIGLDNCIYVKDDDGVIRPRAPDHFITIPCGTCFYCLKRKRQEWSLRLMYEILDHKENSFVTLTFDDFNLDRFKSDYKRPLKLYIDRLRKKIGYRPRYFFISELGEENNRFHFHGILFGTSKETLSYNVQNSLWTYGRSSAGWVNFKTANYLTKYIVKMQNDEKPILMCSNGIGQAFFRISQTEKYYNNGQGRFLISVFGKFYPMPNYYKNKIFDDAMKLDFMLNRMNSISDLPTFMGRTYHSYLEYLRVIDSYYRKSLKVGSSRPKRYSKPDNLLRYQYKFNTEFNTLTNGTIYFSEA